MKENYNFRGQREDEKVLFLLKQNAWVFAKTGLYILLSANLMVFVFILIGAGGFFSYILLIFVLGAGLLVGLKWYLWSNSIYLLTNQRIIWMNQESLFHRVIAEIDLDLVQDISSEVKGPIQVFLNFGTIHIKTGTTEAGLDLLNITDPYDVEQEIMKAHNLNKDGVLGKMEFRDTFGK